MSSPLFGLVLSGGQSLRMGEDKGSLKYHGVDQRTYCHDLLRPFCEEVFISVRRDQEHLLRAGQQAVFDEFADIGPAAGILAAYEKNPRASLLVLACDMPYITKVEIQRLILLRNTARAATAYFTSEIEPLFTIWEPKALEQLKAEVLLGHTSPRKTLAKLSCELVSADPAILKNINHPLLNS